MFAVVTSFSPTGYEQYGKAFIQSFREFWPASVQLICAWEGPGPGDLNGFDLLKTDPCASFLSRHVFHDVVKGKKETNQWGAKAKREGYSYRHDAYKFCHKVFAVGAAARYVQFGRLFWIDADTITQTHVPEGLLVHLLPQAASLCYLPRPRTYSELGFVGYNLERPETRAFITAYERTYADDTFLAESNWDDCWIFDRLVERMKPKVEHINHTSQAQPFDNSVLGHYMTHLKGPRKAA